MPTLLSCHVGMTVADHRAPRDPETQRLVRESLRLVIQSERVLAQLEDHVSLLRSLFGPANADKGSSGKAAGGMEGQ